MKPLGFPKQEKLCSKKSIDLLFSSGKSLFCYPYKILILQAPLQPEQPFAQAMFVVSKRNFKRAVDRNSIRRRMREAYRTSKPMLKEWAEKQMVQTLVAYIYIGKKKEPFNIHLKGIKCSFESITRESNAKDSA